MVGDSQGSFPFTKALKFSQRSRACLQMASTLCRSQKLKGTRSPSKFVATLTRLSCWPCTYGGFSVRTLDNAALPYRPPTTVHLETDRTQTRSRVARSLHATWRPHIYSCLLPVALSELIDPSLPSYRPKTACAVVSQPVCYRLS